MKRFWVSWVQPTDDYRPLTFPPNEGIIGWWCSGYDSDDNATLVALIEAESKESVEKAIKLDWPEFQTFRFFEKWDEGSRLSDRFVLDDWMRERL